MNRKELKSQVKENLTGSNVFKLFVCIMIVNFIAGSPHKIVQNHFNFIWQTPEIYNNLISPQQLYNKFMYSILNISPPAYISFAILGILVWLISPILELSIKQICLQLVRESNMNLNIILKNLINFNLLVEAFILNFLKTFFIIAWSLLLIVPGIIKAYSYSMASYILADHPDMSASKALKESMRLMDGHKFDLFLLQLSFIGWWILTIVTFGLAYIYVGPYMAATEANFYEHLKNEDNYIPASYEEISSN